MAGGHGLSDFLSDGIKVIMDGSCDKCGRQYCWDGSLLDQPACPECRYTVPAIELADQLRRLEPPSHDRLWEHRERIERFDKFQSYPRMTCKSLQEAFSLLPGVRELGMDFSTLVRLRRAALRLCRGKYTSSAEAVLELLPNDHCRVVAVHDRVLLPAGRLVLLKGKKIAGACFTKS